MPRTWVQWNDRIADHRKPDVKRSIIVSCIFYRLRSVFRQERSITFPRDTRFFVTTSHQRYSSSLTCTSSGVSISLGLCLHTNKLAPERHFLPKNRLPSGWQSSVCAFFFSTFLCLFFLFPPTLALLPSHLSPRQGND